MIKASDAIAAARALIGTPYSELDCINMIKKIIRTAPGGKPKYTTASTVSLWASFDASAKYKDLTDRQETIIGARAGELVFKGKPLGFNHEPHHVGIATGEGTVIHSSSVYGRVVETPLTRKEGWTLRATHRYIKVADTAQLSNKEDKPMSQNTLYEAVVETPNGGKLNLRTGAGNNYRRFATIPNGETVSVLEKLDSGWSKVAWEAYTGYVDSRYLAVNPALHERWGVWIPCNSEEEANALSAAFCQGVVVQRHVEESID